MKLKNTSILLCVIVLASLCCFPVYAQSSCPINYSCFITHDEGIPSIHFKFLNNTIQPINYIEYKAALYDSNFNAAYDKSYKANTCRVKISNLNVNGYYDDTEVITNLAAYPTASHVGAILYLKVVFADSTSWESDEISFNESKAKILCTNDFSDGLYTANDKKLHLCDASNGTNSRMWFYWSDDEMGWVHFSDDLKPVFEATSANPCIKLVINNNEFLYDIQTFSIETAKVAVTCYNTGETKYSDKELLSFSTADMNAPLKFALWDFMAGYETVSWYIWSDENMCWEFISNERGPIIDKKSKTPFCLKVEYNNDPFNYMIYEIYMQ